MSIQIFASFAYFSCSASHLHACRHCGSRRGREATVQTEAHISMGPCNKRVFAQALFPPVLCLPGLASIYPHIYRVFTANTCRGPSDQDARHFGVKREREKEEEEEKSNKQKGRGKKEEKKKKKRKEKKNGKKKKKSLATVRHFPE